MADGFVFPDRLEAHAVDDARMAEAYESLDAASRAVLKKCIARLYRIWGERPERAVSLNCPDRSFCLECEDRPADTAVIVCEAGYRHPAAFLAALMPAVLSGARLLLPLFLSPGTAAPLPDARTAALPSAPLLAALELAGVERAYFLDEDAVLECVRELPPDTARLLLIGEKPFGQRLVLHAHSVGLACRSFVLPPKYHNERPDQNKERSFEARPSGETADEPALSDGFRQAFLRLDAGHEHMWIWPDLDPDWFRLRRMRVYSPGALE